MTSASDAMGNHAIAAAYGTCLLKSIHSHALALLPVRWQFHVILGRNKVAYN